MDDSRKIGLSLDEIIKLNKIKQNRYTRSNHSSHRSMRSNRSRGSRVSNYSRTSNFSRSSFCSNCSKRIYRRQFTYNSPQVLQRRGGGLIKRYRKYSRYGLFTRHYGLQYNDQRRHNQKKNYWWRKQNPVMGHNPRLDRDMDVDGPPPLVENRMAANNRQPILKTNYRLTDIAKPETNSSEREKK